ncbi:uncharacterized protein DNG_02590 [Cephalotrichum gorgonifer]|uniref:Uncharacterized protein n=1 Tax=Cephalotrichum gorgonifer TaxID=2041049 RepID=A0AAE8MVD3_9PEZI|nr:uncharacterized protein DNG_02590 [Cephalotrichum gorgonifer]
MASGRSSIDNTGSPPEMQHPPQPPPMAPPGKEDLASLDELEQHQWPPRGTSSHSRTDSASSSQASSYGLYVRSVSANPYSEQQRHVPRRPSTANPYPDMPGQGPKLKHRASYEAQGSSKSRGGQGYRRQSPNLWTSTHYEQLQMQYGGTPFGPQVGGWNPPYVPRSGHYRNRSVASQSKSNAPYRVLHSYYSPAYRHAPIWG